MRNLKRVIAGAIAVAVLTALCATSVFAATTSVKKGDTKSTKTGGTYVVQKNKKVAYWTLSAKQKKNVKTVTIAKTIKIKGKTLKVTGISANALKGIKKLKTIKINANITKINKNAFKGVTKKKLATIKVKVSKKVSKKSFNWLKKQLIKKGFKAKNITRK